MLTHGTGVQGVSARGFGSVDGGECDTSGQQEVRSLTPFDLAMGINALDAASAFLDNSDTIGLDLNETDQMSHLTPLHQGSTFGRFDAVKLLVQKGGDKVDVDKVSSGADQMDALGFAIQGNHTAVVRFLIEDAHATGESLLRFLRLRHLLLMHSSCPTGAQTGGLEKALQFAHHNSATLCIEVLEKAIAAQSTSASP